MLPTATFASPLIPTVAVPGLPRVATVAPDSTMLNVLLPENGEALLTATANVFAAASPSAHFNVPVVVVKSVPATAVPLVVLYATLAAPLEPPVRLTVTVIEPAFCATAYVDEDSSRLP